MSFSALTGSLQKSINGCDYSDSQQGCKLEGESSQHLQVHFVPAYTIYAVHTFTMRPEHVGNDPTLFR